MPGSRRYAGCYEGSGLTVELQEESQISGFIRQDIETVLCPMGFEMKKLKQVGANTIYANKTACHQCLNKCTASKARKEVSFGPETTVVPVKMYGSSSRPLQQLPPDAKIHPNCHILDRQSKPKRHVQVRIRNDTTKIRERMCLSEHPFGTVKWHQDARYLLCKGKEKTTGEMGLSFLVYNMKRVLKLVEFNRLIEAMGT